MIHYVARAADSRPYGRSCRVETAPFWFVRRKEEVREGELGQREKSFSLGELSLFTTPPPRRLRGTRRDTSPFRGGQAVDKVSTA